MPESDSSAKIHIDSDWKSEAAREKQRLAEQEEAKAAAAGPAAGPSFLEVIELVVMQAAIAMGGYQGPGGDRISPNPAVAKHYIDLLDVLSQKTKGNLAEDEQRALDTVLYELRMQFVQVAQALTQAAAAQEKPVK